MVVGNPNGGRRWTLRTAARRASPRPWNAHCADVALAIIVPFITASGAAAKKVRTPSSAWSRRSSSRALTTTPRGAKVHNAAPPFYSPSIEPTRAPATARNRKFVGTLALYQVRVLPFLNGSPGLVTSDAASLPRAPRAANGAGSSSSRRASSGTARRATSGTCTRTSRRSRSRRRRSGTTEQPDLLRPGAEAQEVREAREACPAARSTPRTSTGRSSSAGCRQTEPKGSMKAPEYLGRLYKAKDIRHAFDAVRAPLRAIDPQPQEADDPAHKVIKRQARDAKIWITEIGWGSAKPGKKWPLLKGVQAEADAEKSFHMLIKRRRQSHLKRVYWFLSRSAPTRPRTAASASPRASSRRLQAEATAWNASCTSPTPTEPEGLG